MHILTTGGMSTGMVECLVITLLSAIVCVSLPKMLMMIASMVRKIQSYSFGFPQKLNSLQPRELEASQVSNVG